jgi:hypothetical protein
MYAPLPSGSANDALEPHVVSMNTDEQRRLIITSYYMGIYFLNCYRLLPAAVFIARVMAYCSLLWVLARESGAYARVYYI